MAIRGKMGKDNAFNELWKPTPGQDASFGPVHLAGLPAIARRYIGHAISPGTRIASAVRLHMHGDIRLKKKWYPFQADQVIRWESGFVWRARVKMRGMPITGYDRYIDGEGELRWKLLGIFPIVNECGADVSRSAAERMLMEAVWLPSALLATGVNWEEKSTGRLLVGTMLRGQYENFELCLDGSGGIRSVSMLRWGNPENRGYEAFPFGGMVEGESTFGGFTVPSKLRIGWYFGTGRFEPEGEFFRCIIDEAVYH